MPQIMRPFLDYDEVTTQLIWGSFVVVVVVDIVFVDFIAFVAVHIGLVMVNNSSIGTP